MGTRLVLWMKKNIAKPSLEAPQNSSSSSSSDATKLILTAALNY